MPLALSLMLIGFFFGFVLSFTLCVIWAFFFEESFDKNPVTVVGVVSTTFWVTTLLTYSIGAIKYLW